MSNPCSNYNANFGVLLHSLGVTPEESDYQLCLDGARLGATRAEYCPAGYTFLQNKAKTGGMCVGTCRKGDTKVIREVRGVWWDGDHDVDVPVCSPAAQRMGTKTFATKATGSIFSLRNIFIVLIIVFIVNKLRGGGQSE